MVDISDIAMRQGRRRLAALLPATRAQARRAIESGEPGLKSLSMIAEAALAAVSEDNLFALVVHQAPLGGWSAEVVFRDMPAGISNVMGTPSGHPLETREEAEEAVHAILLGILITVSMGSGRMKPPVFELHGFSLDLDPVALAAAHALGELLPTKEQAGQALEALVANLFPDGVTKERLDSLKETEGVPLLSAIYTASACGLLRYPEPAVLPPKSARH